ncbi:MAG UNVERIFIED_CONTAM: hypothetical protein LVR29_10585 [Microcystis novacekii LVE1205-3]
MPLDVRKALPSANLDTIKNTWGFQDTNKINPQLVPLFMPIFKMLNKLIFGEFLVLLPYFSQKDQ